MPEQDVTIHAAAKNGPLRVTIDGQRFLAHSAELRPVPVDPQDLFSPLVDEWEIVLRIRPSEQAILIEELRMAPPSVPVEGWTPPLGSWENITTLGEAVPAREFGRQFVDEYRSGPSSD